MRQWASKHTFHFILIAIIFALNFALYYAGVLNDKCLNIIRLQESTIANQQIIINSLLSKQSATPFPPGTPVRY
jgi:hypothetical protein